MEQSELYQSVAYLLNRAEARSTPAADIINDYLGTRRYWPAADREAVLNLVWQAIRHRERLRYAWPAADWETRLKLWQSEGLPDLSRAPDAVRWEVPDWVPAHVPDAATELPALLTQAPIVLRANGDRDQVMALLRAEGLNVRPCTRSPYGIILSAYADLSATKPYKKGLLEIQDEGAQLVALDIGVKPRQDVFDFCAGTGGKSLIFAQMMENRGFIQAYDAVPKRLFELTRRAARCHVSIIKIVTKLPKPFKKFDHVVVDAPCTGTGTWRRMPDLRWKLTERQVAKTVALQREILDRAERYVKPGHYLSYITCSVLKDENEDQIALFLASHPNYTVIRQKRYSPARTGTDGFFLCLMQRR